MTTTSPAILNDLDRIEKGEASTLRDLSTEFLEAVVENEEGEFHLRNDALTELNIRKHGICILSIDATDSLTEEEMLLRRDGEQLRLMQEMKPAFTYSVGASRVGIPEMLSFYPNARSNHFIFNQLYQMLLDDPSQLPAADDEVKVFDVFDNPDLPILVTLLNKEERAWAFEDHTCKVESEATPVMLVHIPTPQAQPTTAFIPQELRGFQERLSKRYVTG